MGCLAGAAAAAVLFTGAPFTEAELFTTEPFFAKAWNGSKSNSWYAAAAWIEPSASRKKKPARIGSESDGRSTRATCQVSGK